jgi:DNA-binding GntR family transcriptional regulator
MSKRHAPLPAPASSSASTASPSALLMVDAATTRSDEMLTPAPRTLIELVYQRLRTDIIEGRLAPGEKLRVEHLRLHYHIGAGTLREALTRLVSDALVHTEGQRGFTVTPVSLADLADLTELRLHIELDALRQSIRLGHAEWQQALTTAYTQLQACPINSETRPRWEALNARFHEVLISGRSSPWTLHIWRMLAHHGERYRRLAMNLPRTERDVVGEHRQIYEAALQGQEARAALALEAHIRNTYEVLATHSPTTLPHK